MKLAIALLIALSSPAFCQWRPVKVSSASDTQSITENFRRASLWSNRKLDRFSNDTLYGQPIFQNGIKFGDGTIQNTAIPSTAAFLQSPATFYVVQTSDYLVSPASFTILSPDQVIPSSATGYYGIYVASANYAANGGGGGGDNLGNHVATQTLVMGGYAIHSSSAVRANEFFGNGAGLMSVSVDLSTVTTALAGKLDAPATFYIVQQGEYLIAPATFTMTSNVLGGNTWVEQNFYSQTNGSQTQFTLPSIPLPNSLRLTKNGVVMVSPDDYSLASAVITMVTAPASSTTLIANYAIADSSVGITTSSSTWTGSNTFTGAVSVSSISATGYAAFTSATSTTTFAGWIDIGWEKVSNGPSNINFPNSISVSCSSGKKVLGCGCYRDGYFIMSVYPTADNTCICVPNGSGTANTTVYATCARIK